MLKIANSLRELEFGKLIQVYAQSLYDAACQGFSDDPEGLFSAEQELYQYLSQVFFRTKCAYYAIWEENGDYICALRMEPYRDGFLLSALETVPYMRNQGFAKKLMSQLLEYNAARNGNAVYSHVRKDNDSSMAVHRSCGFRIWKANAVYLDGSVSDQAFTLLYSR